MKMKLGNKHHSINKVLSDMEKPKLKKLQMNVDETLHRDFKMECLKQDREMTEVVVELIKDWLKETEN
jgi:hypothetical protein